MIADIWSRERGIPCDWENVIVTPGGKPIMFYTMLALLDPGDEVLLPNPACPIYESVVNFLGARPVDLPLLDTNDFDLHLKDLESKVTSRTRLLIMNSPQNPTGGVLRPETVEGIPAIARKHGEGHVRFSYAISLENLQLALESICAFLAKAKK